MTPFIEQDSSWISSFVPPPALRLSVQNLLFLQGVVLSEYLLGIDGETAAAIFNSFLAGSGD